MELDHRQWETGGAVEGSGHREEAPQAGRDVAKLRHVEVLLAKGTTAAEAVRTIEVTEQTYRRWHHKYGGLTLAQVRRVNLLDQTTMRFRVAMADLTLEKLR